jgi:hypothetical protein
MLSRITRGSLLGSHGSMTAPTETLLTGGLAQAVRSDSTGVDETRSPWDGPKPLCRMTQGIANNGGDRESFTTAYLIVVNSLTETLHREVARARGVPIDRVDTQQREEVCAAVWTMIRVALAASLLTSRQQQLVLDVLSNRLRSRWGEDFCAADGSVGPIKERLAFYLQQVDPQDPVTTAARIIGILLEAAQVPTDQRVHHTRLLAGLIAHRIVSDVWLFNAWESEGKLGESRL